MGRLLQLARMLESGETSSRGLVERALSAIQDPSGQGQCAFRVVHTEAARARADCTDRLRALGTAAGPLDGIPISVKDLFDLAGEPTKAGSKAMEDAPPAACDAPAVERLRSAGLIVIGRTNMTEFAYSGLGLNSHFGTPLNPYDRQRGLIPGGSSSGAAVSVTDGMAAAALGSDTGGSVRIPAAFCGICGFKPTAARVPLVGVLPLSPSLDSVGPLAPTVSDCAWLDAILAQQGPSDRLGHYLEAYPLAGLRLGVPEGYLLEGLESAVAEAFQKALDRLAAAGVCLMDFSFAELDEVPDLFAGGGIPAAEAYAWHRKRLAERWQEYDPRVASRIQVGGEISAADYLDLCRRRRCLIEGASATTRPYDALIFPTVAHTAPALDVFNEDAEYFRLNALTLRNTLVANLLDRCALTMPCHEPEQAPVGLSLMGEAFDDRRLLAVGLAVERILGKGGVVSGDATRNDAA